LHDSSFEIQACWIPKAHFKNKLTFAASVSVAVLARRPKRRLFRNGLSGYFESFGGLEAVSLRVGASPLVAYIGAGREDNSLDAPVIVIDILQVPAANVLPNENVSLWITPRFPRRETALPNQDGGWTWKRNWRERITENQQK